MKTLDEYLELPYRITIVHDRDEDGNEGFVAEVEELPGAISQGATPEEAVSSVYDAMAGWISIALEDGKEIPS
jgi:predicted RNase H-like HicB family nuclease